MVQLELRLSDGRSIMPDKMPQRDIDHAKRAPQSRARQEIVQAAIVALCALELWRKDEVEPDDSGLQPAEAYEAVKRALEVLRG